MASDTRPSSQAPSVNVIFKAPTALLQSLERSFTGHTVKQCLRSKQHCSLPNLLVQSQRVGHRAADVSTSSTVRLDRATLQRSYMTILGREYLGALKQQAVRGRHTPSPAAAASPSPSKEQQQRPSLWYMERMATVFRFLEVLLEYEEAVEPTEADEDVVAMEKEEDDSATTAKTKAAAAAAVTYQTISQTGDKDFCQQIVQLIASVANVCVGSLEGYQMKSSKSNKDNIKDESIDDDDDDDSISSTPDDFFTSDCRLDFHPQHVSLYCFGELLRLNTYVRSRPFLLSAIYKCVCDIATSLSIHTTTTAMALPEILFMDAVTGLTDHLDEGLTAYRAQAQPPFLLKILGFLVVRLGVLLKAPTLALPPQATLEVLTRLHTVQPQKVERCVAMWLAMPDNGAKNNSNTQSDRVRAILQCDNGCPIGKSILLTKFCIYMIARTEDCEDEKGWYERDVELLLSVCEELLLRTLPIVAPAEVVSRALSQVVAVLLQMETKTDGIIKNIHPGRAKFHRVLVQWLRHSTSQLVVAALQSHIYALGNDSDPLLSLLVSLFFDVRTTSRLRSSVGTLLVSLLPHTRSKLERLLHSHFKTFEERYFPKHKEKRASQHFDHLDLSMIISVMDKLATPVDIGKGCHFGPKKRFTFHTIQSSALRLSVAERGVNTFSNSCKVLLQMRKWEPFLVANILLQAFVECSKGTLTVQDIENICTLVIFTARPGSKGRQTLNAIRVLSAIGKALNTSTPTPLLKKIASCFHTLLSSTSWKIRALSMSTLVRFASSIPAVHKTVLPLCIPKEMQILLQNRLQKSLTEDAQQRLPHIIEKHAASRNFPLRSSNKYFPTLSSCNIPEGSYLITMPTQDGRNAIVLFPPGEKSLEDIRFMLADSAGIDIQTVKSVKTTDAGCKMELEKT